MLSVTFSALRNNAKKYFDAVERGEVIEIYRRGKPIAILSPTRLNSMERWRSARPLRIKGFSLSKAVLGQRDEEN
ncbi:MAG: type II toxin-antitoxin system Phd/YefM family antitoxin [Armatimonadetes bacterium]|nr:type II toxin-antitoxin system Phd/YefM family antitoxin [Armatimonadota bacterium]